MTAASQVFAGAPVRTQGPAEGRAGAVTGAEALAETLADASAECDRARIQPSGDGYRVAGTIYPFTGALFADLLLSRATTPEMRAASAVLPADRASHRRRGGERNAGAQARRLPRDQGMARRPEPDPTFSVPQAGRRAGLVLVRRSRGLPRAVRIVALLREGRAVPAMQPMEACRRIARRSRVPAGALQTGLPRSRRQARHDP